MRSIFRKISLSLILILTLGFIPKTFAYWAENLIEAEETFFASVSIGEWITSYIPEILEDWNLNEWEDTNTLNQSIPEGQLFTYDGELYISIDEDYNPYYHGVPGPGNSVPWAYVSTSLNWQSGTNYRVNSVVVRNGRYFIANSNYNSTDWFVNDPLQHHGYTWSEWREIYSIDESRFDYFPGTTIIDYASPDFNYVIYK